MIYCIILIALLFVGPVTFIIACTILGTILGYLVTMCCLICNVLMPIARFVVGIINFLRPKKRKGVA